MTASAASVDGPFRLQAEVLGALPIVEHFFRRLGVDTRLESFVPAADPRVKLLPAKALGVLVRNLVLRIT